MSKDYLESKELLNNNHKIKPDAFINELLKFADYNDITDCTNLKLQKLLYYSYAVYTWINNAVPFHPKYLRFWAFGPVLKPAYDAFKSYGNQALFNKNRIVNDILIKEVDNQSVPEPDFRTVRMDKYEKETKKAIVYTLRTIGNESDSDLVKRTHKKNISAWSKWYNRKAKTDLEKVELSDNFGKLDNLYCNVIDDIMKELEHYNFFSEEADLILSLYNT